MERFSNLLKQAHINHPRPEVMDVLERHLPYHMLVCSGPTNALNLYQVGD